MVNFNRYGHITEQNVQGLSRQFLTEYAMLLKIQPGALRFESAVNRNDRWYINFQQKYRGVPVYRANIGFTIHENGNVVLVGSDAYPDISIDAAPSLSSSEALDIAKSNFAGLSGTDSVEIRKEPELIILPVENDTVYDYFLTYNIELEYIDSLSVFSEAYFIDANTGNIINHFSNLLDGWINGTVNINYWPEHYYDSQSSNAYKYAKIKITSVSGSTQYQYTNANGYYIFSNLAGNPHWVRANLEGNYIALYNNNDSHTSGYLFPNGTHNWTWGVSDGSNVYYHANLIHDFFKNSPFNYSGMDYRMRAYVNEGPNENGWSNGINIGFGSMDINGDGIPEQWARSSDVVYHEYSHSTTYHLYGNRFIQDMTDPNRNTTEAAAMDEGLADYFAISINNDPIQGESVGVNRDHSVNNTMSQYGAIPGYPWYMLQGAHLNGLIIGGACWDLRQLLGQNYVDELVFEALQMTPHAYDFNDFAYNILLADDNDGNLYNYTPNYNEINQAFEVNHGIPVYDPPLTPATPTGLDMTNQGSIMQNPQLVWNTSSGAASYNIYRCEGYYNSCTYQVIGSTSSPSFTDVDVTITSEEMATGKYYYRVKAVNSYGESGLSNTVSTWGTSFFKMRDEIVDIKDPIPDAFTLESNYPNPFNPTTMIRYRLPEASSVSLVIYDLRGNEVTRWVMANETAGFKRKTWDATDKNGNKVPAGIYLLKMTAESKVTNRVFSQTLKMALIK
ncbi:MAG: T9SS type A sorting domain-containing protein [Candidatus Marinimicrobia bacterium]|nr:T9SS type A sorting domain-containing protein [Candidatus Neomarinimicrobiota bacterium]MBL7010661.1 T9SS type A sorting domain-containing protein [Candidatus Neomarinimicrobiota bacterium]MBL7030540.1 T9SS type A sorting domain-containing protein [Candidatus Neomarinimicrobiota bacterium]